MQNSILLNTLCYFIYHFDDVYDAVVERLK